MVSRLAPETLDAIRGVTEILYDAVDAGAATASRTQRKIARYPYAALALVPGLAGPSRAVGAAQQALTDAVYHAVHEANALARAATSAALDAAERHQKKRGRSA